MNKNEELTQKEAELDMLMRDIREFKNELIENYTKLKPGEFTIGSNECDESPIGYCVFNNNLDVKQTKCVFCNKPEERD